MQCTYGNISFLRFHPSSLFESKKENIFFRNQLIEGVEMTAELIAQLATLFLILGAGPIIVVLLYARGGNL